MGPTPAQIYIEDAQMDTVLIGHWSPRFPKQPGWYWTSSNNLAPQIVHVTAIGASGAPMALDDMGAYVVTADWWMGPIPVPDRPVST